MPATRRIAAAAILLTATLVVGACSGDASAPAGLAPQFAKGGSGSASDPTVTGASPSSAPQDTTIDIRVFGSGFDRGSKVSFAVQGVTSTKVVANATSYISSTELRASVTVAPDADTLRYDVVVTASTGKKGIGSELFEVTQGSRTDPTATWMLPLADADLALKSDGRFSDGTHSVYANGVCNVDATIFATTQKSNTGDAVVKTNAAGKGKSCSRSFTLRYPDAITETVLSFNNLRALQNTTTIIPIGATVKRLLILNPGAMGSVTRCDRLLFGVGDNPLNGAGSDSVLVTRETARRWRVQSDSQSNKLAWCQKTGELFIMPVDFVVVASHDLPE